MIYIIIFLFSFIYSQCENFNVLQCNSNDNCDWIVDIEYGNCSSLTESQCDSNSNCYYDCGMYHGSCAGCCWGDCLGGNYEINNSYCEDNFTEPVDCSELNEALCNDDTYGESCEWIEQFSTINCNTISNNQCDNYEGCSLQEECIQWGSWYTWICYEYAYSCNGGVVQIDDSYCEEININGDVNEDGILNIGDVIIIINMIINNEYLIGADINYDNYIDITDIILIVNIILEN